MNNKNILVVDKDAEVRDLLSNSFGSAGYGVHLAPDSEVALKVLEQESISVIFIDLGIEPLNGFELCEMIRKDRPEAIIYALTAYGKLFGPHEIREAGFDGYFAKPFVVERLNHVVRKAFEKIDQLAEKSRRRAIEQILVIDDEKGILRVIREALTRYGHDVETALDGVEGIQKFDDGS